MSNTSEQLLQDGFELACSLEEVPDDMPMRVEIQGQGVLICRSEDAIFAVDEICPHKRRSMAYGIVFEGDLICPWHGYAFNLETGRCDQRRCEPATVYEVQIVDEQVYVRI